MSPVGSCTCGLRAPGDADLVSYNVGVGRLRSRPEQQNSNLPRPRGLGRAEVAAAVTSAWVLIGILVLLVQQAACGSSTGIRSWPWGIFYGLGTVVVFGCNVIYFDELQSAMIAKARWICFVGAGLAALMSLAAVYMWGESVCDGR